MKKHLIISLAIALLAGSSVLGLFALSQNLRTSVPGFKRTFIDIVPIPVSTLDLGFGSYYIAGYDSTGIVLGNNKFAAHVIRAELQKLDTTVIRIKGIPQSENLWLGLQVNGDRFTLTSGVEPVVFSGSTSDWTIDSINRSIPFFVNLIAPNEKHSFLRLVDHTMEYALGKESALAGKSLTKHNLLTKQVDGLFCKDGMLLFNNENNLVLYTYYYRNRVVVADTNLNLVREIKTIDPIDSVRFTVDKVNDGRSITTSSPTLIVNRLVASSGDMLYINSAINATNEAPNADGYGVPIDIYNILNGDYLGSFYLPAYQKLKPGEFFVIDNRIIVRYERYLLVYQLGRG